MREVTMRLRITLDGRPREVRIEGESPNFRVSIEGRIVPVKLRSANGRVDAEVEGRTIRLGFEGGLHIDGEVRDAQVEWLAEEALAAGGADILDVRPPMPGRIVRVVVKPGDRVRRGAPLFVLEAMKMQNEIPAPVEGTVQEVRVREGDAVAAGEVLVRIGPE